MSVIVDAHDPSARCAGTSPFAESAKGEESVISGHRDTPYAHGPKGGMSLLGFSEKIGARFSKNDLMPSCASAPAAR